VAGVVKSGKKKGNNNRRGLACNSNSLYSYTLGIRDEIEMSPTGYG
jgi:hypothetical protein